MSATRKYQEFERISQVLRKRLKPIREKEQESEGEDDQYKPNQQVDEDHFNLPKKQIKALQKHSRQSMSRSSELLENEDADEVRDDMPMKRKVSRALSQQFSSESNTLKPKAKAKYKKNTNAGNEILLEKKMEFIQRSICEPSGLITVNSLGHALQKYKIAFQMDDVVEMIKISGGGAIPEEKLQNEGEELDLSVSLSEEGFRRLYQSLRGEKQRKSYK